MKKYTATRISADDSRDYVYQLNEYLNLGWEFVGSIDGIRKANEMDTVIVLRKDV